MAFVSQVWEMRRSLDDKRDDGGKNMAVGLQRVRFPPNAKEPPNHTPEGMQVEGSRGSHDHKPLESEHGWSRSDVNCVVPSLVVYECCAKGGMLILGPRFDWSKYLEKRLMPVFDWPKGGM